MTNVISVIAGVVVAIGVVGFVGAWGFGVFSWFAGLIAVFRGQPKQPHRVRFFLACATGIGFWCLAALGILVGDKFGGWNLSWH